MLKAIRTIVGLAALIVPAAAHAQCKISRIAELAITMDGMQPLVDTKINGTPTRFMADSGAFYSIISPGAARSLNLPLNGPGGFRMRGINGTADMQLVTVKTFTLAGVDLPKIQFLVGGSEVGSTGVLGQNVLGIGDAEYDLPHSAIRLFRSEGCEKGNLAYWVTNQTFSMIPIERRTPATPHTVGVVMINGKPVRATFDTGASASMLSLAAAARLGIKPNSPKVVQGDVATGFGRGLVRTWITPLDTFAIGDGETIHNARIRIGDMGPDLELLLGADFFIAHRIYVDNKQRRLFLTYEGGPIFNIKARRDGAPATPAPSAATLAAAGAAPADAPDAPAFGRSGAVALARNDFDLALADFTRAIALAPSDPTYRLQRADAYFRQNKMDQGRADLDQALVLRPGDGDALIQRAGLNLQGKDKTRALADLTRADAALDKAAMRRIELGSLLIQAGQPQRAIAQFDHWITAHPADVRLPQALNGRCWARALAGVELDRALADCNGALRARPGNAGMLDSRGLVQLRRGNLPKAAADYDAALALQPAMAWSLYGRGIVRLRSGDEAGSKKDIAAAIAADDGIVAEAKGYGIAP